MNYTTPESITASTANFDCEHISTQTPYTARRKRKRRLNGKSPLLLSGWIARDYDGELYLHESEPTNNGLGDWDTGSGWIMSLSETPIDEHMTEQTPESRPVQVLVAVAFTDTAFLRGGHP